MRRSIEMFGNHRDHSFEIKHAFYLCNVGYSFLHIAPFSCQLARLKASPNMASSMSGVLMLKMGLLHDGQARQQPSASSLQPVAFNDPAPPHLRQHCPLQEAGRCTAAVCSSIRGMAFPPCCARDCPARPRMQERPQQVRTWLD